MKRNKVLVQDKWFYPDKKTKRKYFLKSKGTHKHLKKHFPGVAKCESRIQKHKKNSNPFEISRRGIKEQLNNL